jgi:tRNA threonylcarbamoyladenosine biosynthesis protein TsaB
VSELVLAIDTALSACSVAITRGEETLVSRIEPMARGQAERLAPLVNELVSEAGVRFSQLDRIAVTRGPGAFTGLRVGLAFARGLALALDRPCIGLSTLDVLAMGASQTRIIAAIGVAGSLFVGAWEGRKEVIAPCKIEIDALFSRLEGPWAVTGSGAGDILTAHPDWVPDWVHVHQELPDPVVLAHLARHADPDTHAPAPLYLRGVDAKLPGGLTLADAPA